MKCLPALFLLLVTVGFGQSTSAIDPLAARIDAYIVSFAVDGTEVKEPAEVATPGDVILYEAAFENRGSAALIDLKPVIPVPTGLQYLAGSASPAPVACSLDGETFQDFPILDTTTGAPIDASLYRALRWELSRLAPGEHFQAQLRAQLQP